MQRALAFTAVLTGVGIICKVASAGQPVRIEYTGTRWDIYGHYNMELRLKNDSRQTIAFSGGAYPWFDRFEGRPWGWKQDKLERCGHEAFSDQRLRPGQSKTFTLPAPEKRSWRLRVPFAYERNGTGAAAADTTGQKGVAWSPTLPALPREWLNTSGTDASRLVELNVTLVPGHGEPKYAFVLKNISSKPLYYPGYSDDPAESVYEKGPAYLLEERHGWRWKNESWPRTWQGLGFRKIPPGRTLTFTDSARSSKRTWRIGLRLFLTAKPRTITDACRPVWWQALPPNP
ncbi:MAG TPA: hypothetical protein VG796_22800 [Verrucomicrobiales bacterium]|nr:hypothetical protein [Verrucomicrobiales bacterium]